MRRFRLLKQEGYNTLYKGEIYDDSFIPGHVSVFELSRKYPEDWYEVFDEPKQLHKDTDLGYFAGLAMQGLISNAPNGHLGNFKDGCE